MSILRCSICALIVLAALPASAQAQTVVPAPSQVLPPVLKAPRLPTRILVEPAKPKVLGQRARKRVRKRR